MIEETAVVDSIDGDYAVVVTQRRSSCGSCNAKGACGTSLIGQFFPQRSAQLSLLNPVQARPGDKVVIGLNEGLLQQTSMMVYAVPLLLFLCGAILGQWLGGSELNSILGGLLGLSIGLIFVRLFTGKKQLRYSEARILRVVTKSILAVEVAPSSIN